ncbi:MAG TPA: BrnA antitoxin family protein [Telluria sp.]|nr:BrnA antitoxin family protein [Telluria sp.]
MDMNKEFTPNWEDSATATLAEPAPATVQTVHKPAPAVQLKQIVTIRLDVDMLDWFKSAGPGYQTRINQVLREYMESQRAKVAAG